MSGALITLIPCILVNQYLRDNLGYKIYKLFDVTKFILVLPTFRLIQQSLSKTRVRITNFRVINALFK